MVGVRDVARAAGVSTATVVRVVKGGASVAPATRAAVEAVIKELGYVPNAAARTLSSGRSQMLGLLVPSIQNPFNAAVAEAMQTKLISRGYSLVISSMSGNDDPRRHLAQAATAGTIAGVAMTSVRPDAEMLRLITRGLPCVFIDQSPGIDDVDVVRTNNRSITFEAIAGLIRGGHRRIAAIGGPESFDTARERRMGYADALSAFEIDADPELAAVGATDERGGFEATRKVLDLPDPPTALFAYNGRVAVGILEAVRAAGLHVPDDVSLIAFDDEPVFEVTDPPVTAVLQPTAQMGELAADLLLGQLGPGDHTRAEHVLASRIVERSSVAPPPATR